jgi:hypothetical protein
VFCITYEYHEIFVELRIFDASLRINVTIDEENQTHDDIETNQRNVTHNLHDNMYLNAYTTNRIPDLPNKTRTYDAWFGCNRMRPLVASRLLNKKPTRSKTSELNVNRSRCRFSISICSTFFPLRSFHVSCALSRLRVSLK